mmetsp:Transcript_16591/g.52924  ORF Transcript_16591/g.52924 Transcript_16591/m.52924 type:complete len:654 (+) Transcript_16591:766-2727(+)
MHRRRSHAIRGALGSRAPASSSAGASSPAPPRMRAASTTHKVEVAEAECTDEAHDNLEEHQAHEVGPQVVGRHAELVHHVLTRGDGAHTGGAAHRRIRCAAQRQLDGTIVAWAPKVEPVQLVGREEEDGEAEDVDLVQPQPEARNGGLGRQEPRGQQVGHQEHRVHQAGCDAVRPDGGHQLREGHSVEDSKPQAQHEDEEARAAVAVVHAGQPVDDGGEDDSLQGAQGDLGQRAGQEVDEGVVHARRSFSEVDVATPDAQRDDRGSGEGDECDGHEDDTDAVGGSRLVVAHLPEESGGDEGHPERRADHSATQLLVTLLHQHLTTQRHLELVPQPDAGLDGIHQRPLIALALPLHRLRHRPMLRRRAICVRHTRQQLALLLLGAADARARHLQRKVCQVRLLVRLAQPLRHEVLTQPRRLSKVRHASALGQQQHPVEVAEQLRRRLVDGADHADAPRQTLDGAHDAGGGDGVQTRGRLVQEQHRGSDHQLHSDGDLLADLGRHPTFAAHADHALSVALQAQSLDHLLHAPHLLLVGHGGRQPGHGRELNGLADSGERLVAVDLLHVTRHPVEAGVPRASIEVQSALHATHILAAGQHVQQRRLAGSRGAHEGDEHALAREAVHVLQQLLLAALDGHEVVESVERHRHGSVRRR